MLIFCWLRQNNREIKSEKNLTIQRDLVIWLNKWTESICLIANYIGIGGLPGITGNPGAPGIPGVDGCNGTDGNLNWIFCLRNTFSVFCVLFLLISYTLLIHLNTFLTDNFFGKIGPPGISGLDGVGGPRGYPGLEGGKGEKGTLSLDYDKYRSEKISVKIYFDENNFWKPGIK